MKFRVIQSDIFVDMVAALGANATPMPYGEVYSAIETGVIDGAENNFPSYDTAKHFEVAKYYSLDEHTILPEVFVMAKAALGQADAGGSGDLQAGRQGQRRQAARAVGRQGRTNPRKMVEAAGAQITTPDKQAFIDAMKPVYEKHVTDDVLKKLVADVQGGAVSWLASGAAGCLLRRRSRSTGERTSSMHEACRAIDRLGAGSCHGSSTLSLWLAGIGLVLMTVIVAWQVFCRYVLNDSPSWTEPGAVMLMSWFIFLGAAVGVRENYHLGFDVLLYVLPKGGKKWLRMISDLVVFAFGVGMIWYGGAACRA